MALHCAARVGARDGAYLVVGEGVCLRHGGGGLCFCWAWRSCSGCAVGVEALVVAGDDGAWS
jgi:hypothetical protein